MCFSLIFHRFAELFSPEIKFSVTNKKVSKSKYSLHDSSMGFVQKY